MDTVKIDKKGVRLIAHRGLSGIELENTISSFVAAANRSYYGIETDVYATADGKFVLMHDSESGRVSDNNINVTTADFEQVRKIKLGKKADGSIRADRVVPTLEEYISVCKTYEKVSVLELKSHFSESQIAEIIEIINRYGQLHPYRRQLRGLVRQSLTRFIFGEFGLGDDIALAAARQLRLVAGLDAERLAGLHRAVLRQQAAADSGELVPVDDAERIRSAVCAAIDVKLDFRFRRTAGNRHARLVFVCVLEDNRFIRELRENARTRRIGRRFTAPSSRIFMRTARARPAAEIFQIIPHIAVANGS